MARIGKNQLVKLQKKYKTDKSIGELYGISRQAVHQLRIKYGIIPVPEKNRERDEEIVREYGRGIPGTKLAQMHNLSVSQTYRILESAGIDCSINPLPPYAGKTRS